MKLIIVGSRTIVIEHELMECLMSYMLPSIKNVVEIVSGGAQGIDKIGEDIGFGLKKTVTVFGANWNIHGKAAGPIRNKQMAGYADALLLIWDGESKGSANMKKNMLNLNKHIYEVIIRKPK